MHVHVESMSTVSEVDGDLWMLTAHQLPCQVDKLNYKTEYVIVGAGSLVLLSIFALLFVLIVWACLSLSCKSGKVNRKGLVIIAFLQTEQCHHDNGVGRIGMDRDALNSASSWLQYGDCGKMGERDEK